ncbi:MAG: serine/threonine protein kinase [Polyangiaceae bacterium]|nr:serine/threonine protein kinase [Polyangiaceae bacterium]
MAAKVPEIGLVLAGRYRLDEKLGEGGMGTVWRAEHLVLCAPVAVKVLDRDISKDEEAHDRFIREARSAASLRSPHVVQILDYGVDDGFPYIAMELLEGETLQQRLARLGTMTALDTARVIAHVARAVARAHEAGVIHRDLKPENVFIVRNEDAEIAKVLDFGVAKVDKAQLGPKGTRTRTGSLLGTPFYMSPEQAQGNKTIDQRSDLWALGVIAYECVTGKRPFESEGLGDLVLQICVRDMPVPSQVGEVPPKFDDWFAKACHRDPEQRFQTARELADGLRDVVGLEARETMTTISDDDHTAPPRSVVVRSGQADESGGTAKTIVEPPKALFDDGESPAISAKKPSLTVQQFGTTQSSVPSSSNRTALLVGVGGLALAVGAVAGFLVLGGPGLLGTTVPTAEPGREDAAVIADPGPSASVTVEPVVERRDRDADEPPKEAGASTADAGTAATDASAAPDAPAGKASADKVDKDKKENGIADAASDRDWGKTTEEPPPKPPPTNALPPPPPPITPDAG